MGKLTRRALLGTAAVGAFGLVAYGGGRVACSFVPRNHPDFFSLLDIPPDGAAARRIGEGALAEASLPSDFDGLATAMKLRPLIAEAVATDCPTTRRQLVQDQCAADFAEGRCVVIDGWVLSETEASLCAAKLLRPSLI
ncbi:hypothetical protein [Methylopila sp. 73B]|uniref:hypothetical protein n=1 Tax=Methylopila sp. 73B TaxID=1120792 RepID=UPI00037A5279|nr:hypothetical protein [Methylopila sp. 73B]